MELDGDDDGDKRKEFGGSGRDFGVVSLGFEVWLCLGRCCEVCLLFCCLLAMRVLSEDYFGLDLDQLCVFL